MTFTPKSSFKLDHVDGYPVVRTAGEDEGLHQIRVESVDAHVQHALLPLAHAYSSFNKPVTWAMGAEEKLLSELVIERLSTSRAAAPNLICTSHAFVPERDDAWISSVEDWPRTCHARHAPAPPAPRAAPAPRLIVESAEARPIQPVEPLSETLLALARAVRTTLRTARGTYDVNLASEGLVTEDTPSPHGPPAPGAPLCASRATRRGSSAASATGWA